MKIITSFLYTVVFWVIVEGCYKKTKEANALSDKMEMVKTDNAFSNMSRQYGMKKAFIEFMDNDGILLRPGHMPVIGADAIDYLSQANDTSYTLTWQPSAAEISSSGDLGFTYGIYLLKLADTTLSGTYVSIWKKQVDGKWKFILDSGNEGTHADTLSK